MIIILFLLLIAYISVQFEESNEIKITKHFKSK